MMAFTDFLGRSINVLVALCVFSFIGIELKADEPNVSFAVNDEWKVFTDVEAPASFDKVPATLEMRQFGAVAPQVVKMKEGLLNLASLAGKFKERDCAMLYNEFASEKAGAMRIGVSADYWMELYINGKLAFSTMDKGNESSEYAPEDHPLDIHVNAGSNIIAVKVLAGSAGWRFVCAATKPSLKFAEDAIWKAGDFASGNYTKSGSALDLSSGAEAVPVGKYGRIRFTPEGTMEFEKRPGIPIRFKAAYGFPQGDYRVIKRILNSPKAEVHKEIDSYVAELRRRGYNMVREWPETFISLFAKADNQPIMEAVDHLDYFFAKLKENGIYVNLNIAGYRMLYKWRNLPPDGVPPGMKTKMLLGDEEIRKMWLDTARFLLCHVNPYTGLAMKDDPMLVCVEPYNELAFALTLIRMHPDGAKMARERFEAFLIKRYGKIEEAIPQYPDETKGRYQADLFEFHYNCARETMQWFRSQLAELGCKAPVAQYNLAWQRFYGDIRYEYDDVVIKNAYFCHPSEYMKLGSKCKQGSSIQDCGGYFRQSISSRFADRPMIETEYNHAFWNQYEYEQPLFPAYAAFQGYTALTLHEVDVRKDLNHAQDFMSSMMDRSSEYLSYFLFVRGDVTPAKNLTMLSVPKSSLFALGADQMLNMDQLKCAFLTRFAVKYEDTPRPERIKGFP